MSESAARRDLPGRGDRGDGPDARAAPRRDEAAALRHAAHAAHLTVVEADLARGRLRAAADFAAVTGFDAPPTDPAAGEGTGDRVADAIVARVAAADRAPVGDALRGLLDGRAFARIRFAVTGDDGRARCLEAVGSIEPGHDSASRTGFATLIDVSERVHIERVLGESEARYRSALRAGRMGSWETDLVAATRTWTEEGMALFGLALPDGRGRVGGGDDEYLNALHPDDRHLARRFLALAHAEDSFVAEYRIVRPDGAVRWLAGHGLVVSRRADGRAQRLVSIMADVTERRQAEQELRIERERLALALQAAQMGAYDFDLRSEALWWSPQMYAVFGVAPGHFRPTRAGVAALIHPDDREHFLRQREQAIADDRSMQLEFRIVRPDGTVVWLGQRARTQYDAARRPVRHYGIAMDITERRLAEQSLRDADRRKDEFVATLAHELRNPLAPISNAVGLLRRGDVPAARVAWCHDVIARQVGQMARLLDDLLDLSRVTRGKLALRVEPLALSGIVERAVEVAGPVIQAAGHALVVELPDHPVELDGDATRLAQVFSNLLINAAKYTPANGRITLRAECRDADVAVSVADTGIGISAAQLPRIFEMFGQVEPALQRSAGGLGIGLALAKRLVEMHGGAIGACSDGAGRGSEFVVRLPRGVAAPPQRAHAEASPSSAAAAVGTLRILVADDLHDSADSLALALETMGHEVRVAYDGEQAVEQAEAFRPDLVFLDLGMPRCNGYDACRRIRRFRWGGRVTIVAQTGWGQAADRLRTREAGFDDHVVKPVDAAKLAALLAAIADSTSGPAP